MHLQANLLEYFVPADQVWHVRKILMFTKQGTCHMQSCIGDFCKALLDCSNIAEAEEKIVFESNLVDWLAVLVLLHHK